MKLPQNLTVTQASLTAAFVSVVGIVVACLPSLTPEKQAIVAAGSLVIGVVFATTHLVHALVTGKQKVTLAELEGGIRTFAQDEINKVNINGVVEDVLAGKNIPVIADIEAEVRNVLAGFASAAPVAPAPVIVQNLQPPTPVA